MKKNSIIFSLILVSLLGVTFNAWAKFGISPSRIEGKFPAGNVPYDNDFQITNYEETPTVVTIHSTDRTINPLTDDWFKLHESKIELAPGETRKVKYTIAIPENATGEYNAWAVFSGEPVGNLMGAGIAIRNSIPIYISVRGTEKFDFEIYTFDITNKDNLTFNIFLKNTGNVHIRTTGTIKITSLERSNENYILPFNDIKWAIIPNETKDYETNSKEPIVLQDGTYKAIIDLHAGDGTAKKELRHEVAFTVSGASVTITEGKIEAPKPKAPKKRRKSWKVDDPFNKPRRR